MRAALFGIAALCAPVISAVPHGDNAHRHIHPVRPARRAVDTDYSTFTDVVTVTAPSAVVWVDQYNQVVRTEFQGLPETTSVATTPDAIAVAVPTFSSSPVAASPEADPTTKTPQDSATPTPVFSVYTPSTDASPSPVPLTTNVPDTTTAAETTSASPSPAKPAVAPPAADNAIANKGSQGGSSQANPGNTANTAKTAAGNGFGIDFELVIPGACKQQLELNSEFGYLASQGYSKVRFYDIGCDLSVATAAANTAGLSVTLGLNTIGNLAGDLQTLIGWIKGNWGPIDTVVIGNEIAQDAGPDPAKQAAAAAAVAAAVNTGRGILQAAGFTKNVVAVDTFGMHQNYPEICAASDYCAVNAHAFFDPNTQASDAGTFVKNVISKIQTNGKALIVTESGWPWQGGTNGAAIPSIANQQAAIASLKSAFAGNPGGLFLFMAYDADYKQPGGFGIEQFWGIYGH